MEASTWSSRTSSGRMPWADRKRKKGDSMSSRITIRDLLQQRPVTRIHRRLAPAARRLSVEPEERRPGIGSVIGEGLGVHPKPGRMKLSSPPGRSPRSGSGSGRAADRGTVAIWRSDVDQWRFCFRPEVFSLLDRGDGVGQGGLADQRSRDLCGSVDHVHWDAPQVSC